MTPTAVILVNYESGDLLRRCVASVLAQDPPPRTVLVVDNASRDDSLEGLPPSVRLLRRGTNDGFAAALLAGLSITDEPFVLTLNPDTVLLPDCLRAAVAALEADHLAGSLALRVLSAADPTRLDATGIGLTSALSAINLDHGRPVSDLDDHPVTVLGPLGGAALWRRKALERAGNFSPRFFLYWEDVDVALRLDRAGYPCRTCPSARVLHEGSASVGRWSRTNVFYMLRNHWPCLIGALPGRLLLRHPLALLLAPLRAAALYALRGRPFSAAWGLLCGAALSPGALLARRRLTRSGSGRRAAERVAALLRDGDRNRAAMRAAGVGGRDLLPSDAARRRAPLSGDGAR
ncbi:MAG: glycosyltransferase family 2 protein [Planctomycetes bacterium]|nr:glycosyltransferase family 2 protein [Planctomycetota bacterium]